MEPRRTAKATWLLLVCVAWGGCGDTDEPTSSPVVTVVACPALILIYSQVR